MTKLTHNVDHLIASGALMGRITFFPTSAYDFFGIECAHSYFDLIVTKNED
jgi:hypothetical protein